MSYLFLANASLEITTAAGVAKSYDVKVRYYKVVPKRAPNGLLTVDDAAPTEFRLTRGAGLGSVPRQFIYFMYGDRTAYAELSDDAWANMPGSTVKVTTVKAVAAEPAPAPVETVAPAAEEPAPAVKAGRKPRRVKA